MARYPLTGSSFIVCLYKGKWRCIGTGLLPRSQADRAGHESPGEDCEQIIRQLVSIDNSQFGFGTTDAIFVVRQLQEKYLAANKRFFMAFIDLEKAFDRVPRKVIWWAPRKLGMEEWIVRLMQWMHVCQCAEPCPCR